MEGKQQYESLADLDSYETRQFAAASGARFLTDPVQPSTPRARVSLPL